MKLKQATVIFFKKIIVLFTHLGIADNQAGHCSLISFTAPLFSREENQNIICISFCTNYVFHDITLMTK